MNYSSSESCTGGIEKGWFLGRQLPWPKTHQVHQKQHHQQNVFSGLVWFSYGLFDMFGHLLFSREAWYAAIKDFIWARSSELSLSQQNVKGDLKISNHVLLRLIKFKIMFCQILFCIRSIVAKFKDKHKLKYAFFQALIMIWVVQLW